MEELDALYEDLLLELECPVCINYMTPPIRQCTTGHSICESCRNNLKQCPLCEKNFTDAKNISLEALARKMHFPCINRLSGCDAKLMLEQKENHEKNCMISGYRCAMDKCPWTGKIVEILEHWNSKKIKSKIFLSFNICHTIIKADSYYANLVQAHGQLFWFKCKLEKGKIFWAVQFIGRRNEAANYLYQIEIFKPIVSRSKMLFRDYCQPVDIENKDLFTECICLSASIDCLRNFVGEDRLLNYYMSVQKVEDETDDKQIHNEETPRNTKKNIDQPIPVAQSWLKNRFLI